MVLFTASSYSIREIRRSRLRITVEFEKIVRGGKRPLKINSILSSLLSLFLSLSSSSPIRRLICHDARAQQFQLSTVGTMISVWRAAHNRFIEVAAARHSLAATRLAAIVMLAIEKIKNKKRKKGRKRKDREKDGKSPEKEEVREGESRRKGRAILFTRLFHLSIIVVIIVILYVHRCLEPMVKPGWKSWRTIRILMMRDSLRKSKKDNRANRSSVAHYLALKYTYAFPFSILTISTLLYLSIV